MSDNKLRILNGQKESVDKCFRCGLCRSVCPSFEEIGLESASPRGRIQFVKAVLAGETDIRGAVEERIMDCLNCMKCAEICPADVRTDRIVVAARGELAKAGKINFIKKLAFNTVMHSPALMSILVYLGSYGQKWFYSSNAFLESLIPRLIGMEGKKFPPFSNLQPVNKWPLVNKPYSGNVKMRVGYFIGCASNLLFTDVADSTIKVLLRNDIEVIIPKGQVCCGIPVYSSGDIKNARKLALRNLKIFDSLDIDCIVTDCASCSSALKHELNEIVGVNHFRVPVYDLNEFLMNKIDLKKGFGDVEMEVTYHDPCHLRRGQKIINEPRDLLKLVPGVKFTEMNEPDRCCGGAGTFSYTHHKLSRKVGQRKIQNIRNTNAAFLATPCPSCRMQIDDLIRNEGISVKTIHPVEILDRAYRNSEKAEDKRNCV